MASDTANAAYTSSKARAAAIQANAQAHAQTLTPGVLYEAPDWLEVLDGLSSMPTPGENGYGSEPSLAGLPYGAVGGVGSGGGVGASGATAFDPASAAPLTSDPAYNWVVAWIVAGILLALLIRSSVGYRIAYYALALILLFLLVTNASWIASALAPIIQRGNTQNVQNTANTLGATAGNQIAAVLP